MLVEIHPAAANSTRTRALTQWGTDLINQISASSDGSRFTFLRAANQLDVYLADFDAARPALSASPKRLTLDERDDFAWAWTPDGTQVIFSSNRNGTLDLFKQRPDSDVAEPFVVAPGNQLLARVTSDGQWVLYTDDQPNKPTQIMRIPLAGGRPEQVVTLPAGLGGVSLHCPYHGGCVLIEHSPRTDLPSVVFVLDPIRGRQQELTQLPAGSPGAALTADGEYFAYIMPEEKGIRNHIRLVPLHRNPPREIVVKNAVLLDSLDPFPTGGFLSREGATPPPTLLFIAENGNASVLWRTQQGDVFPAIPSPDGKHLAINMWTHQSNVWLIDER